jgi:hypothetical protein
MNHISLCGLGGLRSNKAWIFVSYIFYTWYNESHSSGSDSDYDYLLSRQGTPHEKKREKGESDLLSLSRASFHLRPWRVLSWNYRGKETLEGLQIVLFHFDAGGKFSSNIYLTTLFYLEGDGRNLCVLDLLHCLKKDLSNFEEELGKSDAFFCLNGI